MPDSDNSVIRCSFLAATGGAALAAGLAGALTVGVEPVDYVDPFIGSLTTPLDGAARDRQPGVRPDRLRHRDRRPVRRAGRRQLADQRPRPVGGAQLAAARAAVDHHAEAAASPGKWAKPGRGEETIPNRR